MLNVKVTWRSPEGQGHNAGGHYGGIPLVGFEPAIPGFWGYGTPAQ